MLPSQWASSGHKRTKLHWIHRGTAFQTSAKGADVDHDVYFARESLQDGLRRAVQTEQTVNHNEAVCVQSVDVCWTSLSPLTFFLFCFFSFLRRFGCSFRIPWPSFAILAFLSMSKLYQTSKLCPLDTVHGRIWRYLEDCKYCWNRCAICAATGPTWQTPGGKPREDWKGERSATHEVMAVMAVMAVSGSPKLSETRNLLWKPVDSSENRIDRCRQIEVESEVSDSWKCARQHVFGRLMGRLHRCRTTEVGWTWVDL